MSTTELSTLDNALDKFLQQEISIPATSRTTAATSQKYLRNVLRNKAANDPEFPILLANADHDFLGGSFERHTKIWPLDDIDLFIPLDGGNLNYVCNGYRLPFTVAADTANSRLNLPKWQITGYVSSIRVLDGFKAALMTTYSSSEVSIDRHCVNLQTSLAATSESEGIGFDVVPCFLLHPDDGSESFYLVPDGQGGWLRSNPRKDATIGAELHTYHNGTYRKAVRLLKYWNKTQLGDQFKSYYIELAASNKFGQLKTNGTQIWSVSHAFALAFEALSIAYENGPIKSLVVGAPDVPSPNLSSSHKAILVADANNSWLALRQAFNDHQAEAALTTMNSIFSVDSF